MDYDSPLKSLKMSSCVEEDRISHLSKDIICKILSYVVPTKYAIRTSVLSKRWEHLWEFSSRIILEYLLGICDESHQNRELSATTFINSVDKLLFLRDCSHIEFFKLCIYGDFNDSFRARASSWVCAVVMCNVCQLDLHIDSFDSDLGELPWCLFTCKTLVVLKIFGKFILNVPYHVCLPNLKTLSLGCVIYLGDAVIQKLLSGCPVLEDLSLYRYECNQLWTLKVSVSSLKKLTLIHLDELEENKLILTNDELEEDLLRASGHKIVIDAPNLEFINLSDPWPIDIILKELPNIVEAHIVIEPPEGVSESEEADKFILLLRSIVNARRLCIDCCPFLFLSEEDKFDLPRFCNLVFLELKYTSGPIPLMDFLRISPKLEALTFAREMHGYDPYDPLDLVFSLNNPESVPLCLLHSLKVVEIKNFDGRKEELNIVKYLLKNAVILEKMTFFCGHLMLELEEDLTNYPRISTDCHLDFIRVHGD